MLIDEIVAKHVGINTGSLPQVKDFQLTPFLCPLCGKYICGNLSYYCHEECALYGDDDDRDCDNDCCGEVDDIYDVYKSQYPELSEYAHKWWNKYRRSLGNGGHYQGYSAACYIVKMVNILWCLDQKYNFTMMNQILEDRLFDI